MVDRVVNFGAGPATLPLPVLEQVQHELVSLPDVGMSPLEVSHRSRWFEGVIGEAEANVRALLAVPDDVHVVFCQGGATQQFSMVPMHLLRGTDRTGAYLVTGAWSAKALGEATKEGGAVTAWTGIAGGFRAVPGDAELASSVRPDSAYLYVASNETIQGVQFPELPTPPDDVPLVVDGSSDFLSRPIDLSRVGIMFAGAQKNAGPAGVTVVLVRDEVLGRAPDDLPTMLDYRTFVEHGSRHNTPPVFAIYVLALVTRWLRQEAGGLEEQLARNRAKAALLYDTIDTSDGFYEGHAEHGARSMMNVTFRLPTSELDARFVAAAAQDGLVELRGHRSVGGIRASIYNAMPIDGVERLATFMQRFALRPL